MTHGVVFIGQFPPPVTGFSVATKALAQALSGYCRLEIVDTAGRGERRVAFHVRRALRNLAAAVRIIRTRQTRRIVYLACDGGYGVAYALLLAGVARLSGQRLYLHHHSYAYINVWSAIMATLAAIAGESATHIVLAPEMGQALADRYRRRISVLVLSNCAFVPSIGPVRRRARNRAVLSVGLLSNLSADKGLLIFLDVLKEARRRGIPLHGILAGPAPAAFDSEQIARTIGELDGALEYRGPVYGEAKTAFYSDIDVFLFPTRYVNEAQPLVIFEALEMGRSVIATNHGCIRGQLAGSGIVIEPVADVVNVVLERLAEMTLRPETIYAQGLAARSYVEEQRAAAQRLISGLFDAAPASVSPVDRERNHAHVG